MRGRPKNVDPGRKVDPTMPADAYAALEFLASRKRFGNTPGEVARYLILRGLQELTRDGMLPSDEIDRR